MDTIKIRKFAVIETNHVYLNTCKFILTLRESKTLIASYICLVFIFFPTISGALLIEGDNTVTETTFKLKTNHVIGSKCLNITP